MNREILRPSKEDAREIIYGDHEDFDLISSTIIDQGRWSTTTEVIVQRKADKLFFSGYYTKGSTELQDEGPFEYDYPEFTQVFPVEKTVIVYE